ncbi:MAG: TIM-barrel domain-containing protein [Bacteroidota bacterium]
MKRNAVLLSLSVLLLFTLVVTGCNSGGIRRTPQGMKFVSDSVTTEIRFYAPDIVRVIKTRTDSAYDKTSLSVIMEPESCQLTFKKGAEEAELRSDRIRVVLDKRSGAIRFFSNRDSLLLAEKAGSARFVPALDAGNPTFELSQAFHLEPAEHIYGLGQLQNGKMSQRNQTVRLLQDNLVTVVPFFLSEKAYGLYWDNYSPTVFSDNADSTLFTSETGNGIDYYFMAADDADGVIAAMRRLTGEVPMFPYWTYGYWQSKERYKSQEETVGIVKRYRELGVPLDGIIQDWQYWGDNAHWNAMEFHNPAFPDPKAMIDQIHALNAHVIISCWASFGPATEQYKIMKEKGMLLDLKTWPPFAENTWPLPPDPAPSGVKPYDPFNPEARDIYWEFMNKGIFRLGMDGWWLDSTEPDHLDKKEEDFDIPTYLGTLRSVRNAFPLMTVGGVYTHQRQTSDQKRVFILTRSAFAGQQRYGANSWSGDVVSDWKTLRTQISSGLNFSLTGIPYWNSDIGGFFVWLFPGGVANAAYRELYVRWLQFGAFCPMMRSHGTDTPREIWNFGKKGEPVYDAIESTIRLRYALLPYIYSTSWEVSHAGSSMMRALVMDFPDDRAALDLDNEYLFGRNILVCPVTVPQYTRFRKEGESYVDATEDYKKAGTSKSYLPAGTDWYDFWTGVKYEGGQTVERETPIGLIPLYVRAGSVIPLGPDVEYANEIKDRLTIRVYPGKDGAFLWYDDERDNYNYENGNYATVLLNWDDSAKVLTIGERQGTYPGIPEKISIRVILVGEGSGTGLPEQDGKGTEIEYSGETVTVNLN